MLLIIKNLQGRFLICGVPQGSKLGRLLLLTFINDLPIVCKNQNQSFINDLAVVCKNQNYFKHEPLIIFCVKFWIR